MPSIKNVLAVAGKTGRKNKAQARQYSVVYRMPPVGVGAGEGPTPQDSFIKSLAGCIVSTGIVLAAQRKVRLRSLEAVVDGDHAVDVFLGKRKDVGPGFARVNIPIKIDADLSESEKKTFLAEVREHCPLIDNLQNPTPIDDPVL